jgi:acetolactate synthase-1/2/3 large subunit
MKLSDYVIKFLVSKNSSHIFEVCGGAITHLLDSMYEEKDIQVISMHHEQSAAFAAECYSRISKNIGVAMATSGPGATNLITGIASCFFDSIPCLFITGQVNTYEYKFNRAVRQVGFQETDIVSIVKPIVKEATLIEDPTKIRYHLERAVHIAKSGRPGPVLLDIPMDIQRAEVDADKLDPFKPQPDPFNKVDDEVIRRVAESIHSSSRPVVLIGGGARSAQEELLKFIEKTNIPVVTSLMALDILPHDNPSFVGMLGTYGNRYANLAVANADLLLAIGIRFDTRETGTKPDTFARGAKIVHVDIDPNELNNKVKVDYALNCDANSFLSKLNCFVKGYDRDRIIKWRQAIKRYQELYPSYDKNQGVLIDPNYLMHKLSESLPEDAVVCVDVGQNQMWAAQSLRLKRSQKLITQGGMGAMGSALPMAIGASFARPGKPIVVIAGDGGFQLNIQELETIANYQLPIKIILLNNLCYGMVRQFQEQYFNSRFQSTVIGYSAPDFQDVVSAYKIVANKIASTSEIAPAIRELFRSSKPGFLEVAIDKGFLVLPKLSVNKPIEEQEPELPFEELRSNMFVDVLPRAGIK